MFRLKPFVHCLFIIITYFLYFCISLIFSNNVLVCPELNNYAWLGAVSPGSRCMLDGVDHQEDADRHEHSGIYLNSPSNHIIGNHVVGMVRFVVSWKMLKIFENLGKCWKCWKVLGLCHFLKKLEVSLTSTNMSYILQT